MDKYSQNRGDFLLQKWLHGSITWQEERELEQLAKGDAMLADALEGLQILPESDHVQRVENVKTRLQKRTQQKPRGVIFYLPRVTAAAAVIATLAFGIRYFVENEQVRPEVAIIEQPEPRAENREQRAESREPGTGNREPGTGNREQGAETLTSEETLVFEDKNENRSIARERIAAQKTSKAENTRVEPLADTNFTIVEKDAPSIAAEEKEIAAAPTIERAKTDDAMPQLQKPSAARSITSNTIFLPERMIIGKLTDARGEPLIGATVAANGTDRGTTTGLNGDFTLPVTPDTKELTFSYTGFETTAIAIGKNDMVRVQLKENTQGLSEVVVSEYGTNKRESKKMDSQLQGKAQGVQTIQLPMPKGGFDKLESYIQKNIRYPKAAKAANIEGKVVLEFSIQTNGALSNFKIIESLGYGCDEEAIRLLKEGPKWEMTDPIKGKKVGAYLIEFKLK